MTRACPLPSLWKTRRSLLWLAPLYVAAALAAAPANAAGPRLEFQAGDHVALVGNTLVDRMQHDGWLETLLQARFPGQNLTIRNLGFSADEVTLRLRSANFGSPDEWLNRVKADVVFAFFGYNESFAGEAGLPKFKADLTAYVEHLKAQKYNGKTAPRVVLFSSIAHENHHSPDLPDGAANNARIIAYAAATAEVAKAQGVTYVDLFAPSKELYGKSKAPLTINGVHLTQEGGAELARAIDHALFETPLSAAAEGRLQALRAAVLEKNSYWFNRYRTVDGYSVFGGRSTLAFVGGQTNLVVAQREMEVLDIMTANRDKAVWAAATGNAARVDDSNTPPFIPVITNKPGTGPNGEHVFLSGEESITKMTVAKGLKVNLFASEKEFPELAKPVQMSFDPQGRMWVAVWPTYPHWKPKEPMDDKLLIYEDTDGDGKADKQTVFADGLHCPTGFELYNGGVLIAQQPDLMFLKDTDGDGKADVRQRVLSGLDSADTHHAANSFALDPGGALYFQEGTFHHTSVETPWGPPVRNANAAVYRYEPRSQKFEVYIPFGFANPHGHAFDRWGQDIVVDGTGANPYHGTVFSGHLNYPDKHGRPPQVYRQRTRPCPGLEYLSSRHFPEEFQGNLLVGNVIGFQGILRYRVDDKASTLAGTELEPMLSSSDPNFRPSDLKVGPDGALYFLDWQNPIIGHMQHNLRDPSRDRVHGRIYRVSAEGRPLLKPVKMVGAPVKDVLDLLKEPEDRVRYRARIELGSRDTREVITAAKAWLAALDRNDPDYEHRRTEVLWLHQSHNVVDVDLLTQALASPEFHAKAAAVRVLCYWRDRVPGALDMLKTLAADPYPRVRLEAVRAASFFTEPEALEVALITSEHPTDEALDYTRSETLRALEPYWKKAVAEGRSIAFTSDAGARFFLKGVSTDELLKMKRTRPIAMELLTRKGLPDADRRAALADLAKLENKSELRVVLDSIATLDGEKKGAREEAVIAELSAILAGRPAGELASTRAELEAFATNGSLAATRQLGYIALIAADRGVERAWEIGGKSASSLQDLLAAIPQIRDPKRRAEFYPRVLPLLDGLPETLVPVGAKVGDKASYGRYVRIELPGRQRTLTLAEVEVMSDGRNVAKRGKATQKNTTNGGDASKAIDGNVNPAYSGGGQTHSVEGTSNPWWEVDLGSEVPIESIMLYNRTDGSLGSRLAGYSLKVLDESRQTVFQATNLPAPELRASIAVNGGGPEGPVRRAAMAVLTSVPGKDAETFRALAKFVKSGKDRPSAVAALQRIPTAAWPKDDAKPLLDSLLAYVKTVPVADRTAPAAVDALQLGEGLAGLLPKDDSLKARRAISELGVRVIRLGTVLDQMLFDKDRLAVGAGKPVEVVFENNDLMPHNFVVTKPGALEEVGQISEATATQPGALERGYIPKSDKVLVASRLLQPRDGQTIRFNAPTRPGVYPYVCTYPGHWRRMYGALYVVEDLDDYLSDPESYLSRNPLPVLDDLLKGSRTRKEWTFEELAPALNTLASGRNFTTGKQMFLAASCVTCHKLNNVGEVIGPDLTQLDPKTTPADILRSILLPSEKIDPKYQTYLFETESGKVVTGLVLEEKGDSVKVIENPLAKSEPVVLKKADISERVKSPNSLMPKGLLDKLSREEVLDLVAYIAARGDAKNAIYSGTHPQHNHPAEPTKGHGGGH